MRVSHKLWTGLLVMVLVGTLTPTALADHGTDPNVTATPNSDLDPDGQEVLVQVSGFTTTPVNVSQCWAPDSCAFLDDIGPLVNGSGGVNVTVTYDVGGGVTCDDCFIRAESESETDDASITFAVAQPVADLDVTLAAAATGANAPDFVAGESVDYEISVDNLGPSDNAGYSVTFGVPGGTSFVSAGAGCAEASGTVTCTSDGLTEAGTPQTFDISVNIDPGFVIANEGTDPAPNRADLSATATLASTETDQGGANGNDSDVETVDVVGVADLDVSLSAAASGAHAPTFVAGEQAVYTITVDNLGPSDNDGYSVTYGVPADTTFASASAGCAEASGTVTCTSGGITAAAAPQTFSVTVNIDRGYVIENDGNDGNTGNNSARLSATASLASTSTTDGGSANDSDTVTVGVVGAEVVGRADLQVSLTAAGSGPHAPSFVAGESTTYTISVDNLGPSDSAGYSATFGVPSGTTFVSSPCGVPVNGVVTCSSAGLTVAAPPQTFTVTVGVGSGYVIANEATDPAANQANLSATASVTSTSTTDSNSGNNSDSEIVDVVGVADLEITSHVVAINDAPTVDPLVPGNFNFLTADVTVTNNGPSDAADVTVTDTFPTSLLDETTEESELGILTAGSTSSVLTFEADVKNTLRDGPHASTNTVEVSSSVTDDDDTNNNSNPATVDVFTVPDAPALDDAEGGNARIGVSWLRGNNGVGDADGGDDITRYDVMLTAGATTITCVFPNNTPTSGNRFSLIASSANCTGGSIVNGTTYTVEVAARNGAGESFRSTTKTATPCAGCAVASVPEGQRLTMITGSTSAVVGGSLSCEAQLKSLSLGGVTDNPVTPGREDIVVCDEYSAAETAGFGGLIANVREDPSVAGGVCGAEPCIGGIHYTSNVPSGLLDPAIPVGADYVREVIILDKSILGSSAFFTVFMENGTVIGTSATSSQCHKSPPRPDLGCVERIQVLTKKDAPNGANGQGDVIIVLRFSVNPVKGSR